ncbi:MAG: hypothetical protein AB8B51_17180 [Sedimentitalea sp.]
MSFAEPHTAPTMPIWQRVFFAIPVLGWMAKELVHGPKDTVWYALITLFSAWASAIIMFGLPGLFIPAVAMVPMMFVVLIAITWA